MKKLMTMLAAVGMAFGLFADGTHITQTSFEDSAEFNEGTLITTGTDWSCGDDNATLTQTAYGTDLPFDYAGGAVNMERLFSGNNANYLTVKTAFGSPLIHANTSTSAESQSVYFDQLVKFTAFEDAPTETYENAKILLYVRDLSELEGNDQAPETNLYVKAYQWDNDSPIVKDYNLGPIDDIDAWHRVTIKAIKAMNNNVGFEVFVDGIAKTGDAAGYINVAGLETPAKALNTAKKIFPAMATGYELTQVGFAGQGWLDDVTVTTADIGTWAEDKNVTIAWEAGVSSLTYQVNDETPVELTDMVEAGTEVLPYIADMTIKLTPQFATNVGFKDILAGEIQASYTVNAGVYTVSSIAESTVYTIKTKDTTPRIQVGDYTYPNFAEAIAAIGSLSDGVKKTITLLSPVDVKWDDVDGTEAQINAGQGEIIIDLNGKKITGIAESPTDQGYVLMCEGNVKIIDSGVDGGVVANANYAGAVDQLSGALTIDAGIFDGAVIKEGTATIAVNNGKFIAEVAGATLPHGKKWVAPVAPETYYTIGEADYATLAVTATGATADVKTGDKYYLGDTITVTAQPEEGYGTPTITITGAGTSANPYTVVEGDLNGTINVAVTAEALTYTINFDADGGETVAEKVLNYSEFPYTITETTTKTGYKFDGWMLNDAVVTKIETPGNVTVKAKWTATEYTITAVNGTVGGQTSYTYDIEDFEEGESLGLELAADEPASGKTFKEWTITPATTGVSIDDPTSADAAILTIANGTLANFTVTATYEDEQTDPIPVPGPGETVADALEKAGVPAGNPVLETVTEPSELTRLNGIITAAGGFSSDADVKAAQLANLNDTYLLADITDGALLEAPAVIKVEKVESTTTAGTYAFEVTVKSDGESILAEDCAEALAGKVFVSNALTGETDPFAPVEAKNIANVTIANGKATFEVSYGDGAQGFLKIKAEKPVINSQD